MEFDVVVVGAGAAGIMAATRAAERGRKTLLLEKNRRPGVKILMSGGTRCNLTHDTDARGIIAAYGPPGKFLHSALAALSPRQLVQWVEAEGVPTKVESTGKIFPQSNQAVDVLEAFERRRQRSGALLAVDEPLDQLVPQPEGWLLTTRHRTIAAARVVLTTGGKSYPGSGTTGDGFRLAAELGHRIVPPRPALVPIRVAEAWVPQLKGITVPDAQLSVVPADQLQAKPLAQRRASLLFAHFGLTGPAALDVSRVISGSDDPRQLRLSCNFVPGQSAAELATWLEHQLAAAGKRQVLSLMPEEVPRRLAEALLAANELPAETKAAELSKPARQRLLRALQQTLLTPLGTLGFEKAEVTAGGVALDEVDSRTMQSKIVPGLYLAGEVLDLDGPIGGYNFQAAFSTGYLAGNSV